MTIFGFYRKGATPSSGNALAGPSSPTNAFPAAFFDPSAGTFPITADGVVQATHPVDQRVALLTCIALGTLKSSQTVGLDQSALRLTPPEALQNRVTYVVQARLQPLIDNGDILFLGAPLDPSANGRLIFSVNYKNLRLPSAPPVSLNLP